MTFGSTPTPAALAAHEAAHEAGHAVIAQHFGFQDITAQTQGLLNSLIWVNPDTPPAQHLTAYLHLTAAGEAAENVLMGHAIVPQKNLQQHDFNPNMDVVRYLIAQQTQTPLYRAADVPSHWASYWSVYNTPAFKNRWATTVQACETLFTVTLAAPLGKTRAFLARQWSVNRGEPGAPFTIQPTTLAPYLI